MLSPVARGDLEQIWIVCCPLTIVEIADKCRCCTMVCILNISDANVKLIYSHSFKLWLDILLSIICIIVVLLKSLYIIRLYHSHFSWNVYGMSVTVFNTYSTTMHADQKGSHGCSSLLLTETLLRKQHTKVGMWAPLSPAVFNDFPFNPSWRIAPIVGKDRHQSQCHHPGHGRVSLMTLRFQMYLA